MSFTAQDAELALSLHEVELDQCSDMAAASSTGVAIPTAGAEVGRTAEEASLQSEPPPAAAADSTSGYNVRDYQNPDAGAAQALTTKGKGKGKGQGGGAAHCYHCGKDSPKTKCGRCFHAKYCGATCQNDDWRQHKKACRATVTAGARRALRVRKVKEAGGGGGFDNGTCVICLGPVVAPVKLPCGHAYCGACLDELRVKGVAQVCPICREELPPGPKGLYELAVRAYVRIRGMVTRGEVAWASLPAELQAEMDEVVAMLTEAAAQGHMLAQACLGQIHGLGMGVAQDESRAFELYMQAAVQGDARSQYNVGICYQGGEDYREDRGGLGCEKSNEQAVKWWTKAAKQGFAGAQCKLGHAYQLGRGVPQNCEDTDELAAVEWWAKAAEQGNAEAQTYLGDVYENGEGVPQNYERAVELFKLAIDQGYTPATSRLRDCYFYGLGVEASYAEVLRLCKVGVALAEARVLQVGPRAGLGVALERQLMQQFKDCIKRACPLLDQRVVLRDLSNEALNGARGTAGELSCIIQVLG